jgi:hypothetical protein
MRPGKDHLMAIKLKNLNDQYIRRRWAATVALMQNWGGQLESEAKQGAPWRDVTGAARGGIQAEVTVKENAVTVSLSHQTQHGGFLETGTGVHGPLKREITARKAGGLLKFQIGGQWISVKSIQGMKAQPIIKPTVEKNLDSIKATIRELWEE